MDFFQSGRSNKLAGSLGFLVFVADACGKKADDQAAAAAATAAAGCAVCAPSCSSRLLDLLGVFDSGLAELRYCPGIGDELPSIGLVSPVRKNGTADPVAALPLVPRMRPGPNGA